MAAHKSVDAAKTNTPAKRYEPTEQERASVEAFFDKKEARSPAPGLNYAVKDGVGQISIDHEDPQLGLMLLMKAVGTTQSSFMDGLLTQLASVGNVDRKDDPRGVNFMLSVIKSIEPQDEVEAMLAAQMAAVHMATMTFAQRLANVENIAQQDSAEKAFNKLARTFTAQVKALKRYRTGGEQKMTVEHVTVNDGGQAIVGNVTGRGAQKK